MGNKKRQAEETEHLHFTDLHAEHQQLRKAYQNLKQERDMLLKALNVYHKSLDVQQFITDKNL